MSVPIPANPLSGHCAAIDHDTLYVYTPDHFQSLPIKKNATWSEESKGQSVVGPACVRAAANADDPDAALYVIGGETDASEYLGLQRYSFRNGSWETLNPLASVLQTRTNHSAVYLSDSKTILVYGGSPADAPSDLSSQTFLISTEAPYVVQSFTSNAPPTNQAILQPWNSSHAVMVGGQATNTAVWLFEPSEGWQQLGTNLSDPLDPAARAIVVDGQDGSKVLQVYDMSVSPNTVQSIVLLGAGGEPAATGQTVGSNTTSVQNRDLSVSSWPAYNNTNAPTSTRTDCSLSQHSEGIMVMAGGNTKDPVILFDSNKNSWIDASTFFQSKPIQQPLMPSPSSTTSSTPTSTASPTSTTTAAAGSGGESAPDNTKRTLGITLGVLAGVAVLIIILLLILRRRRQKSKNQNGSSTDEKDGAADPDRLSFADRGASFMKEAGLSADELAPPDMHRLASNNNSHNSLAIIAGKFGNKRFTFGHQPKGSFESTTQLVKDKDGNIVPLEQHEMMDIGVKAPLHDRSNLAVPGATAQGTALDKETRIERKRSSGWSKYFATSQPHHLSHIPSVYVKSTSLGAAVPENPSEESLELEKIPRSAPPPALEVDFGTTADGQRLSHVALCSPSISDSRDEFVRRGGSLDIRDGQSGIIVDPAEPRKSQATSISSFGNRSTIGSSITGDFYNETIQTPWTPMNGAGTGIGHHGAERSASSIYTASIYNPEERRPSRGKSAGFFPGAGATYRPNKPKLSHAAGPTSEWAVPRMPAAKAEARDSTASDITVFPSASDFDDEPPKNGTQLGSAPKGNTDMSWLNLGLSKSPK